MRQRKQTFNLNDSNYSEEKEMENERRLYRNEDKDYSKWTDEQ